LHDVVNRVLEDIGAGDVPQLRVMNKIDVIQANAAAGEDRQAALHDGTHRNSVEPRIDRDSAGRPRSVWLSAATGAGLDLLRQALGERLGGERVNAPLHLPLNAGRLHSRLKQLGAIAEERVDEDGWHLRIDAPRSVLEPLAGAGNGEEARLLHGLTVAAAAGPAE
jgi:GTP-binding protein HflX